MNISMNILYPRNSLRRNLLKKIGKAIFQILADIQVNGAEHFPANGPLIVAGNHVGIVEAVLMVLYTPFNLELIGTGDIPIDPNVAFFTRLYGFIPINRGNIDRKGLHQALSVLQQGGFLGLFPEGGIWNPAAMPAQTGIAWLSQVGKAPVLPIGFSGVRDALHRMLCLKRPRLVMNIGEILPPVSIQQSQQSRKETLALEAERILQQIRSLISEEDRKTSETTVAEFYSLEVKVIGPGGNGISIPPELEISHPAELAQMLLQPVIMDVYRRNLRLPVDGLIHPGDGKRAHRVVRAASSILDYLKINPGFLTYRFGIDLGLAMQAGLAELLMLAAWAEERQGRLQIIPSRQSHPTVSS
jgi:1-acyl-sn-glycerol-3-phosphate acyltransferase